MSYDDLKNSVENSRPIELYEFTYQGGTFRYTSADRNIDVEGATYLNEPLSHTPIDSNNEIGRSPITITSRDDFPVSELFNFAPPDDVVGLVIKEVQWADMISAPAIWLGRVLSVDWPSDKSQLKCESILSSLKQSGLRRNYSKNCPHVLYESGLGKCNANRNDHEYDATVLAIDGLEIEATVFGTQDDTFFAGGYIEWEPVPGQYIRRGIKQHIGTRVQVTHPIRGLVVTSALKAYPGCDHTFTEPNGCIPKFANQNNYGGFPHFMGKNPFGNTSVF